MIFSRLWNKVIYLGVKPHLTFKEQNRVRLLNLLVAAGIIFVSVYCCVNIIIQKYLFIGFNLSLFSIFLFILYLNSKQKYFVGRILFFLTLNIFITVLAIIFGKTRGAEYMIIINLMALFIFFEKSRDTLLLFLFTVLCFYIAKIGQNYFIPLEQENDLTAQYFYFLNMGILFIAVFLISNGFQTEYINYQKMVEKQNRELTQLNTVKDKFLSIISHDLRSPLNSLHVTLDLIKDNELSMDEIKTITTELSRKLDNTQGLMDNILHWAMLQSQGFNIRKQNTHLKPLVEDCKKIIDGFEEKNILFHNHIELEMHVFADADMLKLIVRNLFANAVKFSRHGGEISILAYLKDDLVEISVEDTGVGISPENQKKLFNPESNYSTYGTSQEKGTGLGLILCKEFVQQNGGEIRVESKEGEGSKFIFTLPKALTPKTNRSFIFV